MPAADGLSAFDVKEADSIVGAEGFEAGGDPPLQIDDLLELGEEEVGLVELDLTDVDYGRRGRGTSRYWTGMPPRETSISMAHKAANPRSSLCINNGEYA
jgi:hypothetical protein